MPPMPANRSMNRKAGLSARTRWAAGRAAGPLSAYDLPSREPLCFAGASSQRPRRRLCQLGGTVFPDCLAVWARRRPVCQRSCARTVHRPDESHPLVVNVGRRDASRWELRTVKEGKLMRQIDLPPHAPAMLDMRASATRSSLRSQTSWTTASRLEPRESNPVPANPPSDSQSLTTGPGCCRTSSSKRCGMAELA